MIKDFLNHKYGKFVTSQFLTEKNEVIWEHKNEQGNQEQSEVKKHLECLRDRNGERLVPDDFLKVDWGMDFSSWLGEFGGRKEFMFIGAEPHINNNYQLVYDFGNRRDQDAKTTAISFAKNDKDIWHYLAKNFVADRSEENIVAFLRQCYITDLCHLVPKGCGQVDKICSVLGITPKEWQVFRSRIAHQFLKKEIEAVNPNFIVLHGLSSRNFFQHEFKVQFPEKHQIADWNRFVFKGEMDGVTIIAIPHLKGQILNELWRSKAHPERVTSIRNIIQKCIDRAPALSGD